MEIKLTVHYRITDLGEEEKWMAYTRYRWTSYKQYGSTKNAALMNLIQAVKDHHYTESETVTTTI